MFGHLQHKGKKKMCWYGHYVGMRVLRHHRLSQTGRVLDAVHQRLHAQPLVVVLRQHPVQSLQGFVIGFSYVSQGCREVYCWHKRVESHATGHSMASAGVSLDDA